MDPGSTLRFARDDDRGDNAKTDSFTRFCAGMTMKGLDNELRQASGRHALARLPPAPEFQNDVEHRLDVGGGGA